MSTLEVQKPTGAWEAAAPLALEDGPLEDTRVWSSRAQLGWCVFVFWAF